jgi:hypothetical protein
LDAEELDAEDGIHDADKQHDEEGVEDGDARGGDGVDDGSERAQLVEEPKHAEGSKDPEDRDARQVLKDKARDRDCGEILSQRTIHTFGQQA